MVSRLALVTAALSLLLTPVVGNAQTVMSGSVRSDTQAPVGGAVVAIPSLNLSALTNDQGQYRILVPADQITGQAVTISASSIGYKNAERQVTLRAGTITQDFTLIAQAIQLDEVVVTGTAGRLERRAQPAAVATVNAPQIASVAPITSVANLLQSRTPGVVLRNNSGSSGTATTVRIRGITSLELSNEPLVFVDGIRISSQSQNVYGVGNQERTRLNDIKIEDIESMEIVKGPAAAALYGSDANAGVINIITKRGRTQSGFTQTFSIEYGQADPNFVPPDNYARCAAGNATNTAFRACADVPVGTILVDNPLKREKAFGDGRYRNLSWNLRGGGERYTVFVSLGADDENGTLPHNEYGHINGRTNFEFFAHDRLRLELGFGLARVVSDLPQNDNNIYGYLGGGLLGDPRTVGAAKDGWYGNNRQVTAIRSIENLDKTLRIQPRLAATYSPWSWFTNRVMWGGDLLRTRAYSFWAKNDIGWFDNAPLNTGQIGEGRRSQDRFTLDYLGNIARPLRPDLRLDLSFGMQVLTNKIDLTTVQGQNLVNNEVRTVGAASRLTGGDQETSENRQIGLFAQTQFSLFERLYVKGSVRRDQGSTFGAESKPFYSPSVGVSYVISDEPFFRRLTNFLPDNFLTTLRLRAAYGQTGRHPTSGALSTFETATNQITPTTVAAGVRLEETGNEHIRAEKGSELELGFETALLSDRLGLELTYFKKKTTDGILELPVPGSQGSPAPLVNVGALQNTGFELAANARPLTSRNVALELRFAGATLDNKLLDLGDVPESPTRKVGLPVTGMWDYRIREVDLVNNRVIVSDTMEFLGNTSAYPGFEGTLSGTLTLFGNLSFYAQADGRGDVMQYDNTAQFRDRQNGFTAANVLGPAAYGVDANGNPTDAAKIKWMRRFGCIPANYGTPQQASCPAWVTEKWIDADGVEHGGRTLSRTAMGGDYRQDAGFVKLREASVSYRIPNQFVQRYMRARAASVSLTMRNIRTWTSFDGLDPETDQFLTVPHDQRWTVRFFFTF